LPSTCITACLLSDVHSATISLNLTLPFALCLSLSQSTISKISTAFPTALTNKDLIAKVKSLLSDYGYGKSTLVCTSLCCDEVNRPLEEDLWEAFGDHFNMGGLAGFPFGGVTGFGAMAHHIPDGGSCLIVYGPHVGVDSDGRVGTVDRRGRKKGGSCCGSAVAAAMYVNSVMKGGDKAKLPCEPLDAQQAYVGDMLLPFGERLEQAKEPMVELPHALFEAQDQLMQTIIRKGCREVAGRGKIAVLGGIQINTPDRVSDYFLPLRFELLNNKGIVIEDLMLETSNNRKMITA
jgi:Limiting CO2-inducible proteins B/C beta carbonyic anhydrases